MKPILLILCLLFSFEWINAQELPGLCGFDKVYQEQLRNDPAFKQSMQQSLAQWQAYIADKHNAAKKMVVEGNDTIYEIPIVVHVINTGQAVGALYNKSDADIISWIDYTNKIWAATWPAYPNTSNGGAKIPIRFVLARRSPTCAATNGIDRVDGSVLANYTANGLNLSTSNGVSEAQLRALTRWDPTSYYNIYVVNKIDGQDGITITGVYVTGFAYPAGTSTTADGAYMLSSTVDTSKLTLSHELGHAMGLLHTFQGAGSYPDCSDTVETNCNTQGDLICDTEWSPNELSQYPCHTNANTNPCTLLPYNNVQYNIMNYGFCRDRFTAGQGERAVQQMLLKRASLVNSIALDTPLPAPIVLASACAIPVNVLPGATSNIGPCKVILNHINYTSDGYSYDGFAYKDHSLDYCRKDSLGTDLIIGTPYSFTVTTQTNVQRLKAYLDYNNDGIFDPIAGEQILYIDNAAIGIHTITITPPLAATLNTYVRLRVMGDTRLAANGAFNYGPCDTMRSGQVEDFYVRLLSNVPTPTDYISQFAASAMGCNVNLNWAFGNKQEAVTSFILEHSADAKSFTELANIGTKNNVISYHDLKPFDGTNYYRLKWINADNTIAYSSVQRTDVHCNSAVKIYPNPFKSQFTLELNANSSQNIKLEVYDVSGKKVWNASKNIDKGFSKINIDLSNLSDAIYILKVNGNDINNQTMIVKSVH